MPKNTKIVLKNKKIKKKNISNKIILDKVNRLIEIVENTIIYVQKYRKTHKKIYYYYYLYILYY